MKTYFHCAPIILGAGSVIYPGNFGRIIKLYQATEPMTLLPFRERVFEDVRSQEFPHLPSRLSSCFMCLTKETAIDFRNTYQRNSLVYEVEPIYDPEKYHYGSYFYKPVQFYFDGMRDLARIYWSTPPNSHIEVLIPSPIRVLKCLDDIQGGYVS